MRNLLFLWLLTLLQWVLWTFGPFLFAAISLATFVLIDERNVLDAKTALVSLALFNMMRIPLLVLPFIINGLIEVSRCCE